MKKLIIILVLITAGYTNIFAQSMLKVSTADKSVINVSVDSRYFNKSGTSVTVGDLPPGHHYLQIYTIVQDRRGRGRQQQIYEGKVKTYNGMVTLFVYDADSGSFDVQEQDMNSYISAHPIPQYSQNQGNNNGNYDNGNGPVAAPTPVSTLTDSKTNDLKTQVDAKGTDSDKMNILKDALKNEKITTAQVGNMMDWFNFESTKEDFAKWAWDITLDHENYETLANKFSYKNYQDDFLQFIKGKQ